MFTLQRQGPASYTCSDPIQVSVWLVEQGYQAEAPRSAHEYIRLRKAKSLLVIYHNGTILLQGADTDSPRRLLDAQMKEAAPALPF